MPELPEVETTRRHLAAHLPDAQIAAVSVLDPRAVLRPEPAVFAARLQGEAISTIRRRGKYLLFDLAGGEHLIMHRRMSGNVYLREAGAAPDPQAVIVLRLADGRELRFCDRRRLAKAWLADAAEVAALDGALGPEPLLRGFTARRLMTALERRHGLLKPLLLNQALVAGLGNIYVDEALFAARLLPTRTADTLTAHDVRRLHRAIRAVLAQAIANEGTTFRDYRGAVGLPGRNQLLVEVFRRNGQPCPRCRTTIVKTRVGGRGTHYCPRCQR